MGQLEQLAGALQERIKQDLPGVDAHRRAMPADRDPGPRYQFERLKNPRHGGVLLMLYADQHGVIRFPLMQRHEYGGVHSGQVSLPGGRLEEEDQTIVHTALRETEEEIGIPSDRIEVLGSLSQLYIPPSNYLVTPILGCFREQPVFVEDQREVKELFTVSIDDLLDESVLRITDIEVRDQWIRNIPYYHLHGKIVWGATAMILSEFAQLLEEVH